MLAVGIFVPGLMGQNISQPVPNRTMTVIRRQAYLGIRLVDNKQVVSSGVTVAQAAPGGPADRAGIKVNDRILSIGGFRIRSPQDLETALARHRPGDAVEVAWSSRGRISTRLVRLIAQPAGNPFPPASGEKAR